MANSMKFPWGWVVGIGAGILGLVVVASGTKQAVKDDIGKAVGWLNERFGHQWVDLGLTVLRNALPPQLGIAVTVLQAVFEAEQVGNRQSWTGGQKHAHARSRIGR